MVIVTKLDEVSKKHIYLMIAKKSDHRFQHSLLYGGLCGLNYTS